MADKTIGDLNNAPGTVDDSNTLFVVQQAGTAYKLDGHAFILALTSILDGHGGINSIVYTAPVAPSLDGTLTITLADTTQTSLTIKNGKGITSIAKTGTFGLVDTYTITYNDGTTGTFTVTNGAKGDTGDAWYVWIRYAGQQPTQDSDIGTTPDNWMGVYSGTSSTAPTHYTDYQWFQIKGAKGDTGNPATIQSTAIECQASSSGTTVPSGTWSTTIPSVTQGQYLWTRTTVTFNSGSPVVWYSVSYIAVDGSGSPGTATPLVDSGSGAVGVAMAYARQDHQHPLNVASTGTPQMDGTASRGSESTYARSDHIHPANTNKQDKITASGILKGDGFGGVSAAVAGTDYLTQATNYSPLKFVGQQQQTASYSINSSDAGYTLLQYHNNISATVLLTQENSVTIPPGAEIAIVKKDGNERTLTLQTDGVRLSHPDKGQISTGSTPVTIAPVGAFGIITLKKMYNTAAPIGDLWAVYGNMEVVT